MLITPNQTFRHGKEQYEPGTDYEVSEGLGTYFVMSGWADTDPSELPADAAPAPASEVTLDVHDVIQTQGTEPV